LGHSVAMSVLLVVLAGEGGARRRNRGYRRGSGPATKGITQSVIGIRLG